MSITGIGEIATAVSSIVDKFFPDKTQAEKDQIALELQSAQLAAQGLHDQTVVDTAEASNASLFVSGWRPAVGWVCALGFGWTYVLAPMTSYIAALAGSQVHLPAFDLSQLSPILMGMLGLGVMRSYEKVNGIKAGH